MTERAKPKRKPAAKRAARAPISVLLVDDHPLWRETLRKVLERSRFAAVVAEASDGVEAVQRAREVKPDVVVMDIQMPDRNGIDATRDLVREMPGSKVLVLASSDSRAQVLAAIDAGASGYLLKTAVSDEVREAVGRVHAGEVVFPPKLANVVLDEIRSRSSDGAPSPSATGSVIRQEGDFWTIEYDDTLFRLKDTRGVRHLATLLTDPGREFHALDLVSEGSSGAPHVRDAGALLDPLAKSAYKQRLRALEAEVAEAEAWGDIERASRARDEIETLREQLSAAVGLGGRDRKAASASERARVNVTLAIRSTISKITEYSPALAEHLTATIKTGTYCSYTPDPRAGTAWRS